MPWPLRMTLFSTIVMMVFLIYISARFFWSLKMTNLQSAGVLKKLYLGLGFLFLIYPAWAYVSYSIGIPFDLHGFPSWMKYLFWYGFVFAGVMLSWTLFLDLSMLIVKAGFGINRPQLDTLFGWLIIGITGFIFIYTGGKLVWHTHYIQTNYVTYFLENEDIKPFEALCIVHISDLHADKYTSERKMARYVREIQKAEPDLVLFTGDLITSGLDYLESGARALAGIDAAYGVYAVIGDHDYWSGEEEIVVALEEKGVRVLRNENVWIEHDGTSVKLTGLTEIYSQKPDREQVDLLLEEGGGEGVSLQIMFAHQATDRLIETARERGIHLLLGGHTHGGQIRIPFFFYPFTAARMETRYVLGTAWFDRLLLNVNSGLGFTLAPVRYNAPAGVSVILVEP